MSEASEISVQGSQRPTDYSGRTIGPLRLARAMTVNIVGGCCILATLAVLWPTAAITIVFLQEGLGASKTQIGLNLTLILAGTAASLPGAWLFSGLQRRQKTWILLTAAARLFMLGPAIVVLFTGSGHPPPVLFWIFTACLFLVQVGGVFTSPGWWSWMGDLIPESILGTFFGRRFRWMLLAQSAAALAAGTLLDRAGGPESQRLAFFAIFGIAGVLAVVDPLLFWAVPEPARPKPPTRRFADLARQYLEPIRDRAFLGVLIGAGAYGFFFNLPLVFLVLFLRGERVAGVWIGGQASLKLLSLVTVVFSFATALVANQWGRLADRIGHRTVWILCSLTFFTHFVFFFINEHNYVWLALANAAAFGALFAGQQVAVQNMALSMAPPQRREFYMSAFQSVTALASALGPVVGGWLADRYRVIDWITLPSGQPACYVHLLLVITFVGMLMTLPVMVRVPDMKGTTVLPWFGRLLSGDLLRTAWNISVLATASSAPRRAKALRRISSRDGNVLLPEITAALDDSDLTVRREALLALGRLGTPEALDLLRWYLYEPDAAMRAPSIEAIGHTWTPERGALLKRALRDPDRRVRRVAAEALGRSGGREAVDELRNLLADEREGEVLVSVAVALSRLKEFGAVREMLDLAMHSADTTVRSQMVVALADLLSGTTDFSKLWRQDRHWRGSGFAKPAKKLRRQARLLVRGIGSGVQRSRAAQRELIAVFDNEVELFLEEVQSENWQGALSSLRRLTCQCLRISYGYQGDDEDILEFASAVAPEQAQRYWLVTYLQHTHGRGTAQEAPWDGLTLLAIHTLVHGQPPV